MSRSDATQPAYPHEPGHARRRRLHQVRAGTGKWLRRKWRKSERLKVRQKLQAGEQPVPERPKHSTLDDYW